MNDVKEVSGTIFDSFVTISRRIALYRKPGRPDLVQQQHLYFLIDYGGHSRPGIKRFRRICFRVRFFCFLRTSQQLSDTI
ncbi:hypothetical protein L596_018806 [Steinernema carpocapsae]|uniref:Uncharacterized protein n=1 Tax=Steinernema carpocapsae TaxID=34508 RepID=A0A4U5N5R7_STECR|nr:hypothetical protein L596_018806 [Steinernema carpocapsae]